MPDREKVIKGLDALSKAMHEHQCYACNYEFIDVVNEFGTNIIDNALELLKDKETVKQCKDCKFNTGTHYEFVMCRELDICVDSDFYCKYWRLKGS